MSGRKKKLRQKVIDQMLAKQISVPEARARLASLKTGVYQAPRRADKLVTGSRRAQGINEQIDECQREAGKWLMRAEHLFAERDGVSGAVVKARGKPAGPVTGYERDFDSSNPRFREWAAAAAEQELVTKGLLPGAAPAGRPGAVRALVRVPGQDGTFGWQPMQDPAAPGPPIVPPGIAGR